MGLRVPGPSLGQDPGTIQATTGLESLTGRWLVNGYVTRSCERPAQPT